MKSEISDIMLKEFNEPVFDFKVNDNAPSTDYVELYVENPHTIERFRINLKSEEELKENNIDEENVIIVVHFYHNTDKVYTFYTFIKQTSHTVNGDDEILVEYTLEEEDIITSKALELIKSKR